MWPIMLLIWVVEFLTTVAREAVGAVFAFIIVYSIVVGITMYVMSRKKKSEFDFQFAAAFLFVGTTSTSPAFISFGLFFIEQSVPKYQSLYGVVYLIVIEIVFLAMAQELVEMVAAEEKENMILP